MKTTRSLLERMFDDADREERVYIKAVAQRIGAMWHCQNCWTANYEPEVECIKCGGTFVFDVRSCECGEVSVGLTGSGMKCARRNQVESMVALHYVPLSLQETANACGSWKGLTSKAMVTMECAQDFDAEPFVYIET